MITGREPTVAQQVPHQAARGCRGAAKNRPRLLLMPPQPAARATLQPRNSASPVVSALQQQTREDVSGQPAGDGKLVRSMS
jgi:hypothetical protein